MLNIDSVQDDERSQPPIIAREDQHITSLYEHTINGGEQSISGGEKSINGGEQSINGGGRELDLKLALSGLPLDGVSI